MKNIFFIIIIIIISNYSLSQQSYYNSYLINNDNTTITDMCFINNNTGYITGLLGSQSQYTGKFYKTTDGGVTWTNTYITEFDRPYYGGKFSVSMSNSYFGYLVKQHEYRNLWRTQDGGQTFPVSESLPAL